MNDITDYDLFYQPKKTIVVVSGYFDPCLSHHINLFKAAKTLRQNVYLIIGINSDEACSRKKGQPAFMDWNDKAKIIGELECVDEVFAFDDDDGTACDLLGYIYNLYKISIENDNLDIIFANGGDRAPDQNPIPEESWAKIHYPKIQFAYGVGGDKKTGASSDVLKRWTDNFLQKINKNRMNFVLEGKELESASEFIAKHNDEVYTGAIGDRFSYTFTPTSLGTMVSIRDAISKDSQSITDFDVF